MGTNRPCSGRKETNGRKKKIDLVLIFCIRRNSGLSSSSEPGISNGHFVVPAITATLIVPVSSAVPSNEYY